MRILVYATCVYVGSPPRVLLPRKKINKVMNVRYKNDAGGGLFVMLATTPPTATIQRTFLPSKTNSRVYKR